MLPPIFENLTVFYFVLNLLRKCIMLWLSAGIETKFKGAFYSVLVSPVLVPELNQMHLTDEGLLVGAAVTLTKLAAKLKELQTLLPESKTRSFAALLEMLRLFAGQQIRNVAVSLILCCEPSTVFNISCCVTKTVGGNICNASPISDLNPTLMAAGTKLNLESKC